MDDKEVLEDAHWKGWLNEKGLNIILKVSLLILESTFIKASKNDRSNLSRL